MKAFIFSVILTFFPLIIFCQTENDSTFNDFSAYVHLDSITITAQRSGFSVEEFIKIIQNDKSLQIAFYNLRFLSYTYENNIQYVNQKGNITDTYYSKNIQHFDGNCQWMEVENEYFTDKFFTRKQDYSYYTSKLYDRVFYVDKKPCSERANHKPPKNSRAKRLIETRIRELKKLIYTPGQQANIPLIGDKTAIFDEKMIENYDFSIHSGLHESGIESYIFKAIVKPYFNNANPEETVVKYLEIYVEKDNLQVLSRNYKLQYNAGVYNFDILMKVKLEQYKDKYVPTDIIYDGYWKVVGKKREDCRFQFKLLEFIN